MYYTSNYYDDDFNDDYILNDCEFSNEDYCQYDYYYDYYYDDMIICVIKGLWIILNV